VAIPLLKTKLYIPPIRPGLVPRPRLTERLNVGLNRKLTLISAPAGFGKTTLVSEGVASCERPAAWLSLDEGDNDPVRFLAYLIAALQTVEADVGKGALSALEDGKGDVYALVPCQFYPHTLALLMIAWVNSSMTRSGSTSRHTLTLGSLLDHAPSSPRSTTVKPLIYGSHSPGGSAAPVII
jgi:hypothetical protein